MGICSVVYVVGVQYFSPGFHGTITTLPVSSINIYSVQFVVKKLQHTLSYFKKLLMICLLDTRQSI